jgi:hypothetical protein
MPRLVESLSALLYAGAIGTGLMVFAFTAMEQMRQGSTDGPGPGTILFFLILFFAAVGFLKVRFVPLQGLTGTFVSNENRKANRWYVAGAAIVMIAVLLEQCGL